MVVYLDPQKAKERIEELEAEVEEYKNLVKRLLTNNKILKENLSKANEKVELYKVYADLVLENRRITMDEQDITDILLEKDSKKVAAMLGVHYITLYRWCKSNGCKWKHITKAEKEKMIKSFCSPPKKI